MDDIEQFLKYLKPLTQDVNDVKNKANTYRIEFDELSKFFSYVSNDVKKISRYENQKFLKRYLPEISSNSEEYEANAYLIDTDNNYIHILPQYKEALNYINNFVSFLHNRKSEIEEELKASMADYSTRSLANKYYKIFQTRDKFVGNVDEFGDFVKHLALDAKVRINVLCFVNKNNIEIYNSKSKYMIDVLKSDDQIRGLLRRYSYMLEEKNIKFMIKMAYIINLGHALESIVNEELLNRFTIRDIVKAKLIWAMKNIDDNFKKKDYRKMEIYVKEFSYLLRVEQKVRGLSDIKEIKRIIKEEKFDE